MVAPNKSSRIAIIAILKDAATKVTRIVRRASPIKKILVFIETPEKKDKVNSYKTNSTYNINLL